MSSMLRRPRGRFDWIGVVMTISVIASTLTRAVVFALSDHAPAGPLSLARAFGVGFIYDVLVALWVALPAVLYTVFVSRKRYPRPFQRFLRRAGLACMIAGMTFVVAAEVVFFDEFDGRFNFVAVDYLIYPTEVVSNIWQSYPLVWVILGIGSLTAAVIFLFRNVLRRADENDGPDAGPRLLLGGAYALVLAALTLLVSPRLAKVSEDRVLNEVASNGYYSFMQAVLGRDAPYAGWYATRPDSAVMRRLRALTAPAAPHAPLANDGKPLNVVVVLEESFGSAFVGAIHPKDSASITPAFDSLIAQGTLLTHAYSTGNRTIRAIEATTASIPPLPGISIVRRAQSHDLFTLPAVLRNAGYTTEFIYGGRALFDGMGSYARNNGFQRIVEQKDFPSGTYSTAWGVADESIFDRALTEFDSLYKAGAPFYSLVLTVSNHKPYTYPEGRIAQDPKKHKRVFAVRYADWAMGRFMRAAQAHEFYHNTLFVLMGDHGARVYGAAEIPLPSYEVPVLFIKPGGIPAGARIDALASSLDVPPTVLSLLGIPGPGKFLGRDLFAADKSEGRALMTHNSELALMRGGRIAVLGLRGATTLHSVDSAGALHRIAKPDSAGRELIEDAIAYFQGADELYRSGGYRFDGRATAQRSSTSSATSPRRPSSVQRASASTARPAGLSIGTSLPARASRTPGYENSAGTLRFPIDAGTRPSRRSVSTPAPASNVGAYRARNDIPMRARAGPSR